jgi:hypothetical protein
MTVDGLRYTICWMVSGSVIHCNDMSSKEYVYGSKEPAPEDDHLEGRKH